MTCKLCKSDSYTNIGQRNGFNFVRCANCHLVRMSPPPTDEKLRILYENYSRKSHSRARRRAARYSLKLLPFRLLSKGKNFLDVGCCIGAIPEAARRVGFNAHGIDYSKQAINLANQYFPECTFYNETIEEFIDRGLKFDMVYCSEVIEHIEDMHTFMQNLVKLLNKNAILFFTTPDTGHFTVPRDMTKWRMLSEDHVNLYNKDNLTSLFNSYNLRPIFFYPILRANIRVLVRNNN